MTTLRSRIDGTLPQDWTELYTLAALFDPDPGEWQSRALCAQVDPELFFPEKGGTDRPAKQVCQGCEVRPECLAYALEHGEHFGVWGGLSRPERLKLKQTGIVPVREPRPVETAAHERDVEVALLVAEGWTRGRMMAERGWSRAQIQTSRKRNLRGVA